jgi:hypothetical protein
MTRHTKEPWLLEEPSECEMDALPCVLGGKNGAEPVCEILGPLDDEDGPHRGHYDAALILAAPELLRVCAEPVPSGLTTGTFADDLHTIAGILRDTEYAALADRLLAKAKQMHVSINRAILAR